MQEDLVGKIVEAVNAELISAAFKNAMYRVSESATDALTDYIKCEYRLQLDGFIHETARDMVRALLKGDKDEARLFELIQRDWVVPQGFAGVTDNYGVRAAIVGQFKDQILTAETIALREENAQLRQRLEWGRR